MLINTREQKISTWNGEFITTERSGLFLPADDGCLVIETCGNGEKGWFNLWTNCVCFIYIQDINE